MTLLFNPGAATEHLYDADQMHEWRPEAWCGVDATYSLTEVSGYFDNVWEFVADERLCDECREVFCQETGIAPHVLEARPRCATLAEAVREARP